MMEAKEWNDDGEELRNRVTEIEIVYGVEMGNITLVKVKDVPRRFIRAERKTPQGEINKFSITDIAQKKQYL